MKGIRTLVISDIHGCYYEFKNLLNKAKYNPKIDKLILLGDYVSRGGYSKEVVQYIMLLMTMYDVIAIQGNHDHRFVKVLTNEATEEDIDKFFKFGGYETLHSYCNTSITINKDNLFQIRTYINEHYASHIAFLKQLPYYFEDNEFIYVHAGINPIYANLTEQNIYDFLYIKEKFYNYKTNYNKTIVFGHTLTKDLHNSSDIWFSEDKIGIDGGCAFGYQLNCLEIIKGQITNTYKVSSHL